MKVSSIWILVVLENFPVFLTKFDCYQHQKIDLLTSVHLDSAKEGHAKETLELNLSNNDLSSPEEQINVLRLKNPNRLICAHLNISSQRNKFDLLANIIKDKINMLMISKPKLDSSCPKGQFHLHGFSELYRLDRNGNGGGILVFICKDIPSRLIESQMRIERFFVKLNIKKKRKKNGSYVAPIILNFLRYHFI